MNKNNHAATGEALYIRLSADRAAFREPDSGAWQTSYGTGDRRIGAVVSQIEKYRRTIGHDYPLRVDVFLESVRSLFVPEALFDAAAVDGYFSANGWDLSDGERIVVSPAAAGIVALTAWQASETDALTTASDGAVRFWSPIQALAATPENDSVSVWVARQAVYVTLFDRSLQYAEVLPFFSPADLIFYLQKLQERFPVEKMTIDVSGEDSAALRKELRRYYKRVGLRDETDLIVGFAALTAAEKKG